MTMTRQALEERLREVHGLIVHERDCERKKTGPYAAGKVFAYEYAEWKLRQLLESALASAPEPDGELEHLREAAELLRERCADAYMRLTVGEQAWFKRDQARTPATGKDSSGPSGSADTGGSESASDRRPASHSDRVAPSGGDSGLSVPAEPPGAEPRIRHWNCREADERIAELEAEVKRLSDRDPYAAIRKDFAIAWDNTHPDSEAGQAISRIDRTMGPASDYAPPPQPTEPAKEEDPEPCGVRITEMRRCMRERGHSGHHLDSEAVAWKWSMAAPCYKRPGEPAQPAPLPGGKGPVDALRAEIVEALRECAQNQHPSGRQVLAGEFAHRLANKLEWRK